MGYGNMKRVLSMGFVRTFLTDQHVTCQFSAKTFQLLGYSVSSSGTNEKSSFRCALWCSKVYGILERNV
jgi:hypothetical protein